MLISSLLASLQKQFLWVDGWYSSLVVSQQWAATKIIELMSGMCGSGERIPTAELMHLGHNSISEPLGLAREPFYRRELGLYSESFI